MRAPANMLAVWSTFNGIPMETFTKAWWYRAQPIRIGPDVDSGWHSGFFPAADVALEREGPALAVRYRRPGGKESRQTYDLTPLTADALGRACRHSQNLLRKTLCEYIATEPNSRERGKWEYERGQSFWSLPSGLIKEEPCDSMAKWAEHISRRTGIAQEIILTAFEVYEGL